MVAGIVVPTAMWFAHRRLVMLAVFCVVVLTSLSDVALLTDGFLVEPKPASAQDNDSVKPSSTGYDCV